jgi:hypothetical protein
MKGANPRYAVISPQRHYVAQNRKVNKRYKKYFALSGRAVKGGWLATKVGAGGTAQTDLKEGKVGRERSLAGSPDRSPRRSGGLRLPGSFVTEKENSADDSAPSDLQAPY